MPRTKAPPEPEAPAPPPPQPPIARSTRRAVPPEERQVDADRTRAALLAAALEEFSRRGFAGATVREIAARAGVSKDLIAYHFGSKQGLLAAVEEASATATASSPALDATALSLAGSVLEALSDALIDPRALRLRAWRGLHGASQVALDGFTETANPPRGERGSEHSLTSRQRSGELDPNLDPATLELVLLGAIAAPVVFPDVAHQLFGVEPGRREFEVRYREGLLGLIEQLRPRTAS